MIRRFYVHNFRCLQNFELPIGDRSSVLLIGSNGAGKSTVRAALQVLQMVGRGENRVKELLDPDDISFGLPEAPIRFELDVELKGKKFSYSLALELPPRFKELRVLEESLGVDGTNLFTRKVSEVKLSRLGVDGEKVSQFGLDWHLIALPVIQESSASDPLRLFKQWLAHMILIQPIPEAIESESTEETLEPSEDVDNLAAWFSGVVASTPRAYGIIDSYLRQVMPDFKDIKNPFVGGESRSLEVHFEHNSQTVHFALESLSDGEKCYLICGLVLAANESYGPLLCFWDEPDQHLSLDEVQHFVIGLQKEFAQHGQLIATSHHPETLRVFAAEDILVLQRNSHLEPTVVRNLKELNIPGDIVGAIGRGDVLG